MVAVRKDRPASKKTGEQQRKESIRNRQSCSTRYRKDRPVSVKQAPWDEKVCEV